MHSIRPRLRAGFAFSTILVTALGVAASTTGCKNQEKCDEALQTARKAMQDEFLDMALARQWREHAGKICGAGDELKKLDQEILDREAAIAKAIADQAKQEAEAGEKALSKSKKIWKAWDKLEKKEQDQSSLKKTYNKSKKLVNGLTPDYAKQVQKYNSSQYKKRKKELDDK